MQSHKKDSSQTKSKVCIVLDTTSQLVPGKFRLNKKSDLRKDLKLLTSSSLRCSIQLVFKIFFDKSVFQCWPNFQNSL